MNVGAMTREEQLILRALIKNNPLIIEAEKALIDSGREGYTTYTNTETLRVTEKATLIRIRYDVIAVNTWIPNGMIKLNYDQAIISNWAATLDEVNSVFKFVDECIDYVDDLEDDEYAKLFENLEDRLVPSNRECRIDRIFRRTPTYTGNVPI